MNNETIKLETDEKGVEVLLESLTRHFYYLNEVADHENWSEEKLTIQKFIKSITDNK